MSDVFKGQELLRIELDCLIELTDAENIKILYRKPGGKTGDWTAIKDGTTTKIYVDCSDGKIDESGIWEFQPYWTEDDKPIYGDIVTQEFKEPIKSI